MLFSTTILEVALGLVFVYLTLGLVCTAIGEAVNAIFALRANTLQKAIGTMLEDDKLRDRFYAHPLVRTLRASDDALPSYVPTETFARVMIDLTVGPPGAEPRGLEDLRKALATLPDRPRGAIESVLDETVHTVDDAKAQIGAWFDDVMDRAKGWYVRKMQAWTFGAALFVSVGLDADTLQIAQATWADDDLRKALVTRAELLHEQRVEAGLAGESASFEANVQELRTAGLPLGWTSDDLCATIGARCPESGRPDSEPLFLNLLSKIVGLLVTAFAVSLGAPFWFDVLNRVVSARSAVRAAEAPQS
jgi:hypothetical protein